MLDITSISIVDKTTGKKPVLSNIPGVSLGSVTAAITAGVTAAVSLTSTFLTAKKQREQREAMEKENAVLNVVKEWYRDVLIGYNGRTYDIADAGGFKNVSNGLSGVITDRPEQYGVINNGYIYLNLDFPETIQGAFKIANATIRNLRNEYHEFLKDSAQNTTDQNTTNEKNDYTSRMKDHFRNIQLSGTMADGAAERAEVERIKRNAREIYDKLNDRLSRYGLAAKRIPTKDFHNNVFSPLFLHVHGIDWWHEWYWLFAGTTDTGGVNMPTRNQFIQRNWVSIGYNRNPDARYKSAKFDEIKRGENQYNDFLNQVFWMEEAGLMPWAFRGFCEYKKGGKITPIEYGKTIAQKDFDAVVSKITEINNAITAAQKKLIEQQNKNNETNDMPKDNKTPISGLVNWWDELNINQQRATIAAAGIGVYLAMK